MLSNNPVLENALAKMTMGVPLRSFNGGMIMARLRYFDIDRARPGLPPDVAALIKKLEADRTVVHLVNISPTKTRRLIVQGGAYGEHSFTGVKFQDEIEDTNGKKYVSQHNVEIFTETVLVEKTMLVNGKHFAVELPPGKSITLDIGTRRFVNKPTFDFPWKIKPRALKF